MRAITNISSLIDELPAEKKHVFQRLYDVVQSTGKSEVPEDMEGWVQDTFGDVESVESQRVVRVVHRFLHEGALFNELRASRPIDVKADVDVDEVVEEHSGGPFSKPKTGTPRDAFGRVEGKHCVTAANVAKYDAKHGLIIYDEEHPHRVSEEALQDGFEVARKWFDKAEDEDHRYPFLMWNCLWKSGASIVHSHMQVTMGCSRHYAAPLKWDDAQSQYEDVFGSSMVHDMHDVHDELGLSVPLQEGAGFVSLTPRKEKEFVAVFDEYSPSGMATALRSVLDVYIDRLGVQSFNVGLFLPPRGKDWSLPVVMRLVDRGGLSSKTTDMGGMEVYGGENVVSSDPFKVAAALREAF